jgi:pimeloyl-ACP methyl ester carboxylesterase
MKDLILLHGALGSKEQLNPLLTFLQSNFKLHTFNFSGHGGHRINGDFSINRFTEELDNFIGKNNLQGCYVFGYSMGGYVALQLASRKPEAIGKIMTLGTKFDWTPETAAKEIKMMDAEKIESKVPKFASMLSERHAPADWKGVLKRTAEMLNNLGNGLALTKNDFSMIECEVLIALGSDDTMVSREESVSVVALIPNAKFMTIEGIPHPIEAANHEIIAGALKDFF